MAKNKSNKNKDGIGMFNPYKNEIQMFEMIKSSQKLQEFSQNCPRSPETAPKTVLFKMTSPALLLKFTWHAMRPCVFWHGHAFCPCVFGMAICLDHVFLAWPMLFAKIPKRLHCWLHLQSSFTTSHVAQIWDDKGQTRPVSKWQGPRFKRNPLLWR